MPSLPEEYLTVDEEVVAELDDPEAAVELLDMYEEEVQEVFKNMKPFASSLSAENCPTEWPKVWALLHKLKGSSLSIGLTGVAALVETMRATRADPAKAHEWFPAKYAHLELAVEEGIKTMKSKVNQ